MPMGIERLKRWLSNMRILTRLRYPSERLTELLATLVSSYVKREQAWRRENPQREERYYAHPLIQRLTGVDIKEEKELEDWKEESSSGEDWDYKKRRGKQGQKLSVNEFLYKQHGSCIRQL
jgi:hypothetical protein